MSRPYVCLSALVVFLFTAPLSLFADKLIIVGGEPVVYIDAESKAGKAQMHLRNQTSESMPLFLHAGRFDSQIPQIDEVAADIALKESGQLSVSHYLKTELLPGESLLLEIEISAFNEAGEAHAVLYNWDTALATIKAIKVDIPFSISLYAADPSHPTIAFQKEQTSFFELKNSDPMTYPIEWSLWIPDSGIMLDRSEILLPAGSTEIIEASLNGRIIPSWFSTLFKDQEKEGRLMVRFIHHGDIRYPALPTKLIPVSIKLSRWSKTGQEAASTLIILFVLILGGALSLFLNLWIPNKLKQLDLLKRVDMLARKTRAISPMIESSLRVAVRVERLRISTLIRSVGLFSTNVAAVLEGYKSDLELLERRVSLIQDLDSVTASLGNLQSRRVYAPAKILDDVRQNLANAVHRLKLAAPKEIDFQQAHELIHSMDDRLRRIKEEDIMLAEEDITLAEYLAKQITNLEAALNPNTGAITTIKKYDELRRQLEFLFDIFVDGKYEDKSNIHPEHYHWLSYSIEALQIFRQYLHAWQNASAEERTEFKKREDELVTHLKGRTWQSLRHAWSLRYQFAEGTYIETVEEAIKSKAFHIDTIPIEPVPNQLVRLTLNFDCDKLNTCAAREEFTCIWDFGSVGKEEGAWSICHYFRNASESEYSVNFRKPNGKKVFEPGSDDIKKNPISLRKEQGKLLGERAKIEFARLIVVLIVAAIGLFAGAKEKLFDLDIFGALIAIFLIGFGADTVKNLIVKKATGEQS